MAENVENYEALHEAAMTAMREVMDPEIGMNVVELGLVRDLQIEADSAHIVMMMTTPFCPYAPQLLEQTRRAAQQALDRPTTIEMSMEMWTPDLMEDSAAAEWGLF
ncbi:MAG: iron-sulfur cluster assembly protein [Anaerolineae bacterium]|nr:iron-sulfur cluster assembly protein [Anaerolineae bacterium]